MDKLPSALELFRLGLDTVEIAKRLNVTEAVASRLVFEQRCIPNGRSRREKIRDRSALLEMLHVDIESGEICWRAREGCENEAWNKRFADKKAGGLNSQGYVVVNIQSTHHRAHHIVWTVANGEWPCLDIDHIDGDRGNNAISNLREVTRSINLRNKGTSVDGAIPFGIRKERRRWRASISVDRRLIELGRFDRLEDAISARLAAEREFGFSPDHGRRAAYGRG